MSQNTIYGHKDRAKGVRAGLRGSTLERKHTGR